MNRHIVLITPDTDPSRPNTIDAFVHCAKCMEERPADVTPREWARLEVGIQLDGTVQVWCCRHETNIVVLRLSVEEVQ